jgi:hypothetical protein
MGRKNLGFEKCHSGEACPILDTGARIHPFSSLLAPTIIVLSIFPSPLRGEGLRVRVKYTERN